MFSQNFSNNNSSRIIGIAANYIYLVCICDVSNQTVPPISLSIYESTEIFISLLTFMVMPPATISIVYNEDDTCGCLTSEMLSGMMLIGTMSGLVLDVRLISFEVIFDGSGNSHAAFLNLKMAL